MNAKLLRIASVLISAMFGVVVVEIALQFAAPYVGLYEPYFTFRNEEWHTKRRIVPDRVLHYSLQPNTKFEFATFEFSTSFVSNARGNRGRDLEDCDRPRRIFMLGDSMIHAAHVSDGFTSSEALERLLVRAGYEYCVFNLGVGSYSGVQYFNQMRLYGDRFRPDVVIVSIFPNDPFADATFQARTELPRNEAGLLVEMGELPNPGPYFRAWHESLYVPWIIRRAWEGSKRALSGEAVKLFYDATFSEELDAYAAITMRYMKAIDDMTMAWGGSALFAVLPWPNQVAPDQVEPGFHSIGAFYVRDERRLDYQRRMEAAAAQAGVGLTDVLMPMRERAAAGVGFYLRYDGHFGVEGNREYAAVLFDALQRGGYLVR